MEPRKSVERLRAVLSYRFAAEARDIDAQMLDDFYDGDAHESWLERFCDKTNAAIARRDEAMVLAHLSFMETQLDDCDEACRQAIDVGYAENLMWNVDSEAKRWVWPLVPKNLKQLYVDMWGEPTF